MAFISLTSGQALLIDRAQPVRSPDAGITLSQRPQDLNLTQFGAWTPRIENCPPLYTSRLELTYGSVKETINRAIAELRVRVIRHDNEERRKASFKDYQYIQFLLERLLDMQKLRPMTGLKPHREILQWPHLACVSPDSAPKYAWLNLGFDLWTVCRTTPYPRTFLAPYTAYIFVCPQFFSTAPQGITNRCPAVVNNKFVGNEEEFYLDSQLYQMLARIYKLYLQGQAIDAPPLDWNECVLSLTPRESVLRPRNVALWTFCEKPLPLEAKLGN
ncbi:MAG: hypothetical protein Q9221_008937 [Calogaya cf. arnoldii]